MPVSRPTYCTREDLMSASDIKLTTDYARHLDAAIEGASDSIDGGYPNPGGSGLLKRAFYPYDRTIYVDWPNFQRAYPWRIWLNAAELADITVTPPVVKTGTAGGNAAGTVIPESAIFWGNPNYPGAPYRYLELDRSQSYAFGAGPTPQRDVSIAATFGYDLQTEAVGALASDFGGSVTDTAPSVTWTTARVGVGDLLFTDSERLLVTGRTFTDTSQILQTPLDALTSSVTVAVVTGADYNPEDTIQLDSEQMLVQSVTGNNLTVIRGWNGTALAEHSGSEVYALWGVTVVRAVCGTAVAAHTTGAEVYRKVYPAQVHELALAEAQNIIAQGTSAWARTMAPQSAVVPGAGLPDLRLKAIEGYGRKARIRNV